MSAVDAGTGEVIERPVLNPRIAAVLETVGIHRPDPTDALHRALAEAVGRTLTGSYGAQLIAMRFEVAQFLREAGEGYATAKAKYEHHVASTTVREVAANKTSRTLAQQMAEGSDEGHRLLLELLVAEKREQWLRKLLDTFAAAGDNHRTDRADQRAADQFQAHGHVPEQR
ncbi:hypothetical protein [Curtobacterium sp. MCBD17_028]|uniref:hypothetical protein n=1 Tax=Curtobacterium sp. MCBD17_028 TaxID=2175670 RepID=UPI000DA8139D|nr:hypothetical protein [Curtobacterium sp. MCBD17_028]PZE23886.1 hypothetical protein DEI86_13665 [Curtobacterium sp. MCBD17_028]